MAFSARVFRILIASPSDVTREREAAVQAIQHWNDLNSADRQVVLLPVRWETHSAPEYGQRPQAVINRQVADPSDAVVGIFWTRIGSPTGVADSGTIEEIERAANEGKLVMLYFSTAPVDPDTLSLEQLAKLREFKKKTFPNALIAQFSDTLDFRDKFLKQLDIQVKKLISEQADGSSTSSGSLPATDIDIQFADGETEGPLGCLLTKKLTYLKIDNPEDIPDYEIIDEPPELSLEGVAEIKEIVGKSEINKNYYRQMAFYVTARNLFFPFGWWLKNKGIVGAKDVYVDLTFSTEEPVLLYSEENPTERKPTKERDRYDIYLRRRGVPSSLEFFKTPVKSLDFDLEINALQPQREFMTESVLWLGAIKSCRVQVDVKIYADTLAKPEEKQLFVEIEVDVVGTTVENFTAAIADKPSETAIQEQIDRKKVA